MEQPQQQQRGAHQVSNYYYYKQFVASGGLVAPDSTSAAAPLNMLPTERTAGLSMLNGVLWLNGMGMSACSWKTSCFSQALVQPI